MKKTNKHHITPRSKGGSSKPHNIVKGCDPEQHQHYHTLFGSRTPQEICIVLDELFPEDVSNIIKSHLSVYWWTPTDRR
ncbi:MAG: hypothetical protein KKF62_19395 [Bacteroidetes bacterium]|nr:hypothetical protein [Bacteroidota bacterium]